MCHRRLVQVSVDSCYDWHKRNPTNSPKCKVALIQIVKGDALTQLQVVVCSGWSP